MAVALIHAVIEVGRITYSEYIAEHLWKEKTSPVYHGRYQFISGRRTYQGDGNEKPPP